MARASVSMRTLFFDRATTDHLEPREKRLMMRVGGAVRITARRSLRYAPQKSLAELTDRQRESYLQWVDRYKSGLATLKPRRPERSAQRGKPPLLHRTVTRPKSPLRELLYFAYDPSTNSVVIGPEYFAGAGGTARRRGAFLGSRTIGQLEQTHPFMAPAFATIQSRIAGWIKQSFQAGS